MTVFLIFETLLSHYHEYSNRYKVACGLSVVFYRFVLLKAGDSMTSGFLDGSIIAIALFGIGIYGLLARRNIIKTVMSFVLFKLHLFSFSKH